MSLGSDLELGLLLRHIVESGRDLVGARYAALGVLDPSRTSLQEFLTIGMDEAERTLIGELPKGHGILGLLIRDPQPLRLPDLTEHAERYGFPPNHPPMRSFLGVPLYVHGEVFGNLYFTEKVEGEVFTDIDEELAVALAAAAAIALENARLHQRTQELTLLAERERFGRDLHDTVIQRIFATGLALHTTARMVTDPAVQVRIVAHIEELDEVVRQLRTAIFQLDVRAVAHDSLRQRILATCSDAGRSLGFDPVVRLDGPIDTVTTEEITISLTAVIHEALANVARHAHAERVDISVTAGGGTIAAEIVDDGVGISDHHRAGDGLVNIRERARSLGGAATISPAPGGGTRVCWSVPVSG
jgi:signal transduction histidine kinase